MAKKLSVVLIINRRNLMADDIMALEKLPSRRASNLTITSPQLSVKLEDVPDWRSCPPPQSASAVWSSVVTQTMAEHAMVLALSIQVQHCRS